MKLSEAINIIMFYSKMILQDKSQSLEMMDEKEIEDLEDAVELINNLIGRW